MMADIKHPKHQIDAEACIPSGDNNLENVISVRNSSLIDTDDALLRAQGHEAAMPRSFSAIASLGLAFRYSAGYEAFVCQAANVSITASLVLGFDI